MRYLPIAIVVGVVLVGAGVAYAMFSVPSGPNVRIVEYSEGLTTIAPAGKSLFSFKVQNHEDYSVSDVRVEIGFKGDQKYFTLDPKVIQIGTLDGKGGTSGSKTITILGGDLGGQASVGSEFTINVFVGSALADQKTFTVTMKQ